MHHPTTRSAPARRARLVAALTAVCVLSTLTAAVAQESFTVEVAVGSGSRTLEVASNTGAPLTSLTLTPGQARSYRVRVVDTDYVVGQSFTVLAENGNLYRVTGTDTYSYDDPIPSGEVDYGTTTAALAGLGVDLTPVFTLTEAVFDQAACETAVGGVAAGATCAALGTALGTATVADLPVVGDLEDALDLSGVVDDLLGLTGNALGGSFDVPSYEGIGAGDAAAPTSGHTPTTIPVMRSTPLTDLSGLTATLTSALGFVAGDEVSEWLDAGDVLSALNGAGLDGLVLTLSALTAEQQAAVLDLLFDLDLQAPVVGDLSNLVGTYTAFPTITANPAAGTPAGAYAGTHTVTLVSP
jgi:hypothetical protein